MINANHVIIREQHALIEQIAQRQILWPVANRHHGHDFLTIQKKRERAFHRDTGFNDGARMISPRHAAREARIGGIGADDQGVMHGRKMGGARRRCKDCASYAAGGGAGSNPSGVMPRGLIMA